MESSLLVNFDGNNLNESLFSKDLKAVSNPNWILGNSNNSLSNASNPKSILLQTHLSLSP